MADAWTNDENSVLVAAYMELVESLAAGKPVVKTHVYRHVSERIGRVPKSVEFKMLNVSGVLVSLGYGFPLGLAPAHNFQASLTEVVRRELEVRPVAAMYLRGAEAIHQVSGGIRGTIVDDRAADNGIISSEAALSAEPSAASTPVQPSGDEVADATELFGVSTLWDFATGGADVAALPGKRRTALRAPSPAAVDAGVEWMRTALLEGAGARRILFLVGGPGGGKSHVAASLTAGLEPVSGRDDGLAHRSYTYRAPGGSLRVINDATIPPEDWASPMTIATELDASTEDFVVACVNRGVLVDEAPEEPQDSLGSAITTWLRRTDAPTEPVARESPTGPRVSAIGTPRNFVRQGLAVGGSDMPDIDVLAVFVDVCSLLEERPESHLSEEVVSASDYEVAVFSPSHDRTATPAGLLASRVAGELKWESTGVWDPIAANLDSLASSRVRNGLLSVLRASEIASSQLLSYREIWGAMARVIAGPLPETLAKSQLCHWYDEQAAKLSEGGVPSFDHMRQLAAVRLHEALFAEDRVGRHPILRATTAVDPARDMVPGAPETDDSGWATPVMEAFAGAELGASPLERLIASAPTRALDDMVTPFDQLLDASYVRWINEESDAKQRAQATSWYGRYLTRMMALAHGYPAFGSEIHTWTQARALAPALPPELETALTTLVSPRREPDDSQSKSLIPLFASRTEPLRGRTSSPTLSVVVEDVKFRTHADGEKLLLYLTEGNNRLGAVVLDLQLIREALASHGGWAGMTDATDSTAPRLERFRSLRLIPKNRGAKDLRIATSASDIALSMKEQA